jgi:hypothetical protein
MLQSALALVVQDDRQKRLVDLDPAVVFDEAQLPELVHEHIDPRARRADHFCQHLLRDFVKYALGSVFLTVASD